MDEGKKVSIKFKNFCSKKIVVKNINFQEKQFCSFWTECLNHHYVESLSEGLQKVKVRKFVPDFGVNEKKIDLCFPFTKTLFSYGISHHSHTAFYSGEIKTRYYIQDCRDFEINLFLKNIWAGNAVRPLIHYSFLEFRFYIHLLLEKISYSSKKKITFFVEIDFDLEGRWWNNERKNTQMDKESYFVAIYK